jgi:hypothetical protein
LKPTLVKPLESIILEKRQNKERERQILKSMKEKQKVDTKNENGF